MKSVIGFLTLGMRGPFTGVIQAGAADGATSIETGYGANYGMAY